MRKDVYEFISSCEACIRGKTQHQQQPILVEKSVMNEEIFGTVFMDFTVPAALILAEDAHKALFNKQTVWPIVFCIRPLV